MAIEILKRGLESNDEERKMLNRERAQRLLEREREKYLNEIEECDKERNKVRMMESEKAKKAEQLLTERYK